MNEEEVRELYEELSELYGMPMPIYFVYERRPKVITPKVFPESSGQLLYKITVSRQIGVHFQLRGSGIVDPFGFIVLSKGTRGIRKDEAVHEFFHYFDYVIDFFTGTRPVDEASVRSRTRKYMSLTRKPRMPWWWSRYLGCNDCTHVTHTARSESYLCVKRGMWIRPWLVNTEDGLPECLDYVSRATPGCLKASR